MAAIVRIGAMSSRAKYEYQKAFGISDQELLVHFDISSFLLTYYLPLEKFLADPSKPLGPKNESAFARDSRKFLEFLDPTEREAA